MEHLVSYNHGSMFAKAHISYAVLGFDYELRLSTRPSDYMGELKLWEEAVRHPIMQN